LIHCEACEVDVTPVKATHPWGSVIDTCPGCGGALETVEWDGVYVEPFGFVWDPETNTGSMTGVGGSRFAL
jgi:hypothetical protein